MREIFKSGSVGGAPGNRCFYPEVDRKEHAPTDARGWHQEKTKKWKFMLYRKSIKNGFNQYCVNGGVLLS